MGQIVIPGYTLKRKLGQGGMAAVFLAVQESFGREVAIKLLVPSLAKEPDFAERFMREARTMAQLTHPNVIVVHDVGVANGLHYYAMAFHNGGDLTHRIRNGGVAVQDALRITRQMADALAYAHEQGIVHRDIKPDNVLFRERDDAAILTDFGIAKSLNNDENQLTQAGATVGTPKYMSPEQARGQRVDGRADLYSLGCVLYEMLTGQPPFLAEEAVTLAIKHCQDPVPRLRGELVRLQPLIDRLLAKEAAQRHRNGHELVEELDRLIHPGKPVSYQTRPLTDTPTSVAATQIQPALQQTQLQPPPKPAPKARYEPFFRSEEEASGNMLNKRYAMKAAFSCEDYEEFKKQFQALQDLLGEWLQKRGRKARHLEVSVQAHPWILGRVREVMSRGRNENTPFGTLIGQAEVILHVCDETDPEGKTMRLSDKDGKPLKDSAAAS
ncbi:MAG TPA: serine/threonine-protein kinase [Moraxellaceae bacterium]